MQLLNFKNCKTR